MSVTRFGISIEQELLTTLDDYVKNNRFSNRSQAIRHLINKNMIEHKWQCNNTVAGSITLFYDPHKREILNNIAEIREQYSTEILTSQQIMLSENHTLEIIAVKGIARRLTELSDRLISTKGIQHGKLTMTRAE
ncbi:MAG: nickel-responsive transcriptional regulator NikR [Prolixibacteraceae bacterium]|nr:nickel-responsive transcriptional regulator NikR [Prolixibacteraceae bacterium]MBN2650635.1 nickel-responsive transcriptional regulator NikR [Prolixibacteraceae bacterium]